MALLLDLIYALAVCLAWPFLLIRRYKRGPGSLSLGERFGDVPARAGDAPCIWVHAVSLGEINAARTVVAEIEKQAPDAEIVISSTTQTGITRARQIYPDRLVFRFPLDFSFVIRRVMRRLRPSIVVLMELEVWPNLIEVAVARGVPVTIANGRVTEEKSMRRFNKPLIRTLARRMFRQLRWVGAQDEEYAERFVRLGAASERVEVVGAVKYDAADISDRIDGQEVLAAEMGIDPTRPLWVCGSTGPDEEALILDAYEIAREKTPDLLLAIIPRKPERFNEVADLIARRGFTCRRRSNCLSPAAPVSDRPTSNPVEKPTVFLGDTMGELRKFYALATVVFVGRSLVPMGGSDMMEAAGLAKPVLYGPHTENFREAAKLLIDGGGGRLVTSAESLAESVVDLLNDVPARETMCQAARAVIVSRRGAAAKTVSRLLSLIDD